MDLVDAHLKVRLLDNLKFDNFEDKISSYSIKFLDSK